MDANLNNNFNPQRKKSSPLKFIIILPFVLVIIFFISNLLFNARMIEIQKHLENRELSEAKTKLDNELEKNPSQFRVYLLYSDYYLILGDYAQAEKILEAGFLKLPDNDKIIERLRKVEMSDVEFKPMSIDYTTESENNAAFFKVALVCIVVSGGLTLLFLYNTSSKRKAKADKKYQVYQKSVIPQPQIEVTVSAENAYSKSKHFPPDFSFETTNSDINALWKKWNKPIHMEDDSFWRRQRALKEVIPLYIDKENFSAVFKSYEDFIYTTTLTECSCFDFEKRNLPCKHMYRLFYSLTNNDNPIYSDQQSKDIVSEIVKMNSKTLDYFIETSKKLLNGQSIEVPASAEAEHLLNILFFEPSDEIDKFDILMKLTKDELLLLLVKNNIKDFKQSNAKPVLVSWIVENHPYLIEKLMKNKLYIKLNPVLKSYTETLLNNFSKHRVNPSVNY